MGVGEMIPRMASHGERDSGIVAGGMRRLVLVRRGILGEDDEENVIEDLRRHLRLYFHVTVATGQSSVKFAGVAYLQGHDREETPHPSRHAAPPPPKGEE